MKRLFLLRHAQAQPHDGGKDKDRALSPRGIEEARALGVFLERRKLKPEMIFCSDARRTLQTCEAMSEKFDHKVGTINSKNLYDAKYDDLLGKVRALDNHLESAMLIAHNPGIYELCAKLAHDGPNALLSRLDMGYAPGTLGVIEFAVEDWAHVGEHLGTLVELVSPGDYLSPSPAGWN